MMLNFENSNQCRQWLEHQPSRTSGALLSVLRFGLPHCWPTRWKMPIAEVGHFFELTVTIFRAVATTRVDAKYPEYYNRQFALSVYASLEVQKSNRIHYRAHSYHSCNSCS